MCAAFEVKVHSWAAHSNNVANRTCYPTTNLYHLYICTYGFQKVNLLHKYLYIHLGDIIKIKANYKKGEKSHIILVKNFHILNISHFFKKQGFNPIGSPVRQVMPSKIHYQRSCWTGSGVVCVYLQATHNQHFCVSNFELSKNGFLRITETRNTDIAGPCWG